MKESQKAVFLSALVLPGLGQITLKRYKLGVVLIIASVVSVVMILRFAIIKARAIVDQLLGQGMAPDVTAVSDMTARVMTDIDNSNISLLFWIFIACWVIGIADAWLAGRPRREKKRSYFR